MFPWNRLRGAATALTVAAALSTGALVASPANAAQGVHAPAPGIVATAVPGTHKIALRITMPASNAAPAYSVICYANIGGPTISGFNLVVAGTTTCNYPVTDLVLTVTLYWNGNVWGRGTDLATQTVAAYAQGPCIPGTFYGVLFLEVTWPPGVTGAPTYTTRTPSITINSDTDC